VPDWVQTFAGLPDNSETVVLHLFGGPYLTVDGRREEIPEGSKRLLAFVALHDGRVARRHAAGILWPIGDDARAAGNLRSALWRLNRAATPLITASKSSLALEKAVLVDLHVVSDWASRLASGSQRESDLVVSCWDLDSLDLLPGWYDDWALMERERIRQRLLHALEVLSSILVQNGRCAEAIEAAMLAVCSEPLRESAQFRLIEAHIAEGNLIEGRRRFDAYRRLLLHELGTEPDPRLADLVSMRAKNGNPMSNTNARNESPHDDVTAEIRRSPLIHLTGNQRGRSAAQTRSSTRKRETRLVNQRAPANGGRGDVQIQGAPGDGGSL
jgi:DNA-binding SARP family transcriptional activator